MELIAKYIPELLMAGVCALIAVVWKNTLAVTALTAEMKHLSTMGHDVSRLKNGMGQHGIKIGKLETEVDNLKKEIEQ